jgi:hypothetical protein
MQTIDTSGWYWLAPGVPFVPILLVLLAYRRLLNVKRQEILQLLADNVGTKYRAAFGDVAQAFNAYYSGFA